MEYDGTFQAKPTSGKPKQKFYVMLLIGKKQETKRWALLDTGTSEPTNSLYPLLLQQGASIEPKRLSANPLPRNHHKIDHIVSQNK